MTLDQNHDTSLGLQQSFCEVESSNVLPKKDMDRTRIWHFPPSDHKLDQMTLGQNQIMSHPRVISDLCEYL